MARRWEGGRSNNPCYRDGCIFTPSLPPPQQTIPVSCQRHFKIPRASKNPHTFPSVHRKLTPPFLFPHLPCCFSSCPGVGELESHSFPLQPGCIGAGLSRDSNSGSSDGRVPLSCPVPLGAGSGRQGESPCPLLLQLALSQVCPTAVHNRNSSKASLPRGQQEKQQWGRRHASEHSGEGTGNSYLLWGLF